MDNYSNNLKKKKVVWSIHRQRECLSNTLKYCNFSKCVKTFHFWQAFMIRWKKKKCLKIALQVSKLASGPIVIGFVNWKKHEIKFLTKFSSWWYLVEIDMGEIQMCKHESELHTKGFEWKIWNFSPKKLLRLQAGWSLHQTLINSGVLFAYICKAFISFTIGKCTVTLRRLRLCGTVRVLGLNFLSQTLPHFAPPRVYLHIGPRPRAIVKFFPALFRCIDVSEFKTFCCDTARSPSPFTICLFWTWRLWSCLNSRKRTDGEERTFLKRPGFELYC